VKLLPIALCLSLVPINSAFQTGSSEKTPMAGVRGRVLQGPGGPPVRKANVQLNGRFGGKPAQYSAITDAEGQFTVSEVQAGRYIAVVEHPGFVQSAAGKGRASITVQEGSAKNELILFMEPAAIITGKIVDLDGDAMRNVSVVANRVGSSAGARTAHNSGYGNTNDLGEFRISDLRAGRYKIIASPPQGARPAESDDNGTKNQTIYLPTRYPGVLNEEQAVAVEIHAGTETRIDFGMLTGRAYRVSGSVTGVPRKSSMAQIMLEPQAAGGGSQPGPQEVGETGKFEFKNVLPGTYSARVILVTFDGGKPEMQMVGFGQAIEVGNSDVQGLLLQPEPGGQVKGKFRLDTDQRFDWTQLGVTLISLDGGAAAFRSGGEMSGPPLSAKLKLDGSFEVENVPGGNYQLYVGGDPNKLADYFTKSVSLDGRDVSDSGFSVTAKTYLDVVVSANGASIAGKVVDDKGQPVADVTVVGIPSGHRARFDLYQRVATDASGNFNLRGLSAGKYSVLAFEELQEDVRDADFLKSHEGRGEVVEVDEGSKKSVLLKLIAYEDAAP